MTFGGSVTDLIQFTSLLPSITINQVIERRHWERLAWSFPQDLKIEQCENAGSPQVSLFDLQGRYEQVPVARKSGGRNVQVAA